MRFAQSLTCVAFWVLPNSAMAVCWNAEDTGDSGPAVEICINEQCEKTRLTSECPLTDSLIAGYANGLSVAIDLATTPPTTKLSKSGVAFSVGEVETASCRELDGGDGCKFGKQSSPATTDQSLPPSTATSHLADIKKHFASLLPVDAEGFQNILIEANLLYSKASGEWDVETEAAVGDALELAELKGIPIDVSTVDALFRTFQSLASALFDPRSGLSRKPFDGAQMLVVASRRTYGEAESVVLQLESALSAASYPNRSAMVPALNGWIAVTAGMYSADGCQTALARLKGNNLIPSDSYCSPIEKFDPMTWTN